MSPRSFIFWSLVTVIALAPLPFGSNRPWSWPLLSLLVGLLVVLWAVAALRDHSIARIEWQRSRMFVIPFFILVLWFLTQASGLTPESWHHPIWQETSTALGIPLAGAISLNPEASHTALMRLLSYGGVFWLAFQFGRNDEYAKRVFWAVAVAGILYAIYGLTAHLSGSGKILWFEKWAYKDVLTSTFINRNNYATYAGITLIATLTLLLAEIRHILHHSPVAHGDVLGLVDACGFRFYFLVVAVGTIFTAILLTQSRGGFLGIAIGVGAFFVVSNIRLRKRKKAFAFLPTAIAGTLALGIFGTILLVSGQQTFGRIDGAFSTSSDRTNIYQRAADAIGDAPVTGMGIGTFRESFHLYRDETVRFAVETIDLAHNTYLEFALEGGLPALLLMGLLVFYLTLLCFLGAVRRTRNALYPAAGVALSVLVGTHAMIDFSLQIPAVAVTYLFLIGAAVAQSWSSKAFPEKAG